ncbi:MAG: hypothetical protein KDB61_08570 [Planctomycetes bacterium]|nr:hypothetical protein [Planctomycetota bacterium]
MTREVYQGAGPFGRRLPDGHAFRSRIPIALPLLPPAPKLSLSLLTCQPIKLLGQVVLIEGWSLGHHGIAFCRQSLGFCLKPLGII